MKWISSKHVMHRDVNQINNEAQNIKIDLIEMRRQIICNYKIQLEYDIPNQSKVSCKTLKQ